MKNIEYSADFCVVGGGLAGLCAAVSVKLIPIKTCGSKTFNIFSFEVR